MRTKHYLSEFIRQCLFFKSNEPLNWLFGILAWGSLWLLAYSVYSLMILNL
jgi:hypothetical protein